jgi:hypothetical protein
MGPHFLAIRVFTLYNLRRKSFATVAQTAEQSLRKRRVKGSIPFGGSYRSIIPPELAETQPGCEQIRKIWLFIRPASSIIPI